MGLLNIYKFSNITNLHFGYRFKAQIASNENFFNEKFIDEISYNVASITKPIYPIATDSINQYYGDTRFVMPVFEFDKATMDITYVEDDKCSVQTELITSLNIQQPRFNGMEYVRIYEYDYSFERIISAKQYHVSLKSFDMPEYSRNGEASIITITAHYIVYEIKNIKIEAKDAGFEIKDKTSK